MRNEKLYFSTKVELKMNGVTYRPAMCYPVPPFAKTALQPFVDQGKVTFHDDIVHFVNGAAAHMTKDLPVTEIPAVVEEEPKAKKKAE